MSTDSGTHTDRSDQTVAGLVHDVSELVPKLVRQEVQLAKTELTDKARSAGAGAGLLGGGGVVALFATGVLIAAAVLGLAQAMPTWAAALIVAAVLFVVAGVLLMLGRSRLRRATPPVPEQAMASTAEDVRAVKESARR